MKPLVSVIIPAYNSERTVGEAVASALAQTWRPLEIIAINDGSTDGTADVLKGFGDAIVLIDRPNRGVYASRNEGVARARGGFVAFLDADDAWKPEKVARQMEALARHPEVSLAATRVEEMDAAGRPLERRLKAPPGIHDRPVRLYDELLRRGNPVSLSSVLIRREALERAGGFYDAERILSADYDLWIRIAADHVFYVLSEPLTRYRVLKTSLLHGSLEKEYGAQMGIIQRHRHRFTSAGYRRRLGKLYLDWAESAFYRRDRQAWRRFRTALALDPSNWRTWLLGAKNGVKEALRAFRRDGLPHRFLKWLFFRLVPRALLLRRFPGSRQVYLTFDDGPHPLNTEEILKVLQAHGVRATFFMTGIQVKKYPEIARRVAEAGHEVASHSWFHRRNPQFEMRAMRQEIVSTEDILQRTCGAVTRTFRPPYGRITVALMLFAVLRRMTVALWSLDSEDDRAPSPQVIVENCRAARAGDVVLFHDDNRAVLEALPAVLADMKARGLEFASVRDGLRGASLKGRRETAAFKAEGSVAHV